MEFQPIGWNHLKGINMIEAIFALTLASAALYLAKNFKRQKAPVPVKVEKRPRS